MGGRIWRPEEEEIFWTAIIPKSPKRLGVNGIIPEHSWEACAKEMQERMPEPHFRKYTALSLFEHWFQNVCKGRISPHGGVYARPYIAHMERLGIPREGRGFRPVGHIARSKAKLNRRRQQRMGRKRESSVPETDTSSEVTIDGSDDAATPPGHDNDEPLFVNDGDHFSGAAATMTPSAPHLNSILNLPYRPSSFQENMGNDIMAYPMQIAPATNVNDRTSLNSDMDFNFHHGYANAAGFSKNVGYNNNARYANTGFSSAAGWSNNVYYAKNVRLAHTSGRVNNASQFTNAGYTTNNGYNHGAGPSRSTTESAHTGVNSGFTPPAIDEATGHLIRMPADGYLEPSWWAVDNPNRKQSHPWDALMASASYLHHGQQAAASNPARTAEHGYTQDLSTYKVQTTPLTTPSSDAAAGLMSIRNDH